MKAVYLRAYRDLQKCGRDRTSVPRRPPFRNPLTSVLTLPACRTLGFHGLGSAGFSASRQDRWHSFGRTPYPRSPVHPGRRASTQYCFSTGVALPQQRGFSMSFMPVLPVPYICWRAVRVRILRAAQRLGVDASDLLMQSDEELDEAIIYFAVRNRTFARLADHGRSDDLGRLSREGEGHGRQGI